MANSADISDKNITYLFRIDNPALQKNDTFPADRGFSASSAGYPAGVAEQRYTPAFSCKFVRKIAVPFVSSRILAENKDK